MDILFVDSDQRSIFVAQELLTNVEPSFKLTSTASQDDFMQKLSTQAFDAIISAYEIPGVNALDLLKHLREEGHSIPFIILTDHWHEEIALGALNLGADYFFSKGADLKRCYTELAHLTRTLIQQRQAEKEKEESEIKYRCLARHHRLLINEMPNGFVLMQTLLDEDGTPSDYRFLEINPAFEELTGINRDEMIGLFASEIFPKQMESWVEACKEVTLKGNSVKLEDYSQDRQKLYEITFFRPAPGQLAAILADITQRRLEAKELAKEAKELDRLEQKITERLQRNLLAIQERAKSLQGAHNPTHAIEISHRTAEMIELLNWSSVITDKRKRLAKKPS
ncbi:MAG: response regulator [Candidatus Hodarchaeota archaeon]